MTERNGGGFGVVLGSIRARTLALKPGNPLPIDIDKLSPATFVGEVVMNEEITPLLRAAMAKS